MLALGLVTTLLTTTMHDGESTNAPDAAGKSQAIEMTDVAAETVELLLQFIYGCLQQPDLTLPEVVALFQASDKYALPSLHHQCTRLLTAHISFGNIFQLADLAQLHNCPSLLQVGDAALNLCRRQLSEQQC